MPDFSFLKDDDKPDRPIRVNAPAGRRKAHTRKKPAPPMDDKTKGCLGCLGIIVVSLVIGAIVGPQRSLVTPDYEQQFVSAARLGDGWPLTVKDGYVRAYRKNLCITFVRGRNEYGLNGIARGNAWGFKDIGSITSPGRTAADLLPIGLDLQNKAHGK
jgi:hypothetical protein